MHTHELARTIHRCTHTRTRARAHTRTHTHAYTYTYTQVENMQTVQATLCTGALLAMLREILGQLGGRGASQPVTHAELDRYMLEDMLRLSDLHFAGLADVAREVWGIGECVCARVFVGGG